MVRGCLVVEVSEGGTLVLTEICVQNQRSSSELDLFTPTEEHGALREMLTGFVKTRWTRRRWSMTAQKFNIKLFRRLGELGFGITAPEKVRAAAHIEYGGSEMDALAAVIAHEELSSSDPAFCLSLLGALDAVCEQRCAQCIGRSMPEVPPDACSGAKICSMAMSEPSVSTDVLGMRRRRRVLRVVLLMLVNDPGMWITNGALNDTELGDTFLVYARTGNTGKAKQDFSSFLVEKGFESSLWASASGQVRHARLKHYRAGVRELQGASREHRGLEGGAVLCMMRNLEIERVTLAAMVLGIARRSLERKLKLDSVGNRVDTDGVKLYCGDMAKRVADRAIRRWAATATWAVQRGAPVA
ncbi:Isovaleryl-CoA dehydrogenase [Phytophthora cinnamomi]|uniref:Isovaleryl-CoA dehydrogenase n=1 Tax=Phytophthora cinnamomi TaxID=4785 RepID=UPI003559D028|nr:Isovaleryl-CoA dehydrogenase [Phytophthora cinnamomi]